MVFKRYWYTNYTILAPLKCGTRWLADYTNPLAWTRLGCHTEVNQQKYDNGKLTYFIYREPEEHFITAFHTEVLTYARENMLEELVLGPVVNTFKTNYAEHWSTNMWEVMYNDIIKTRNKFEFVKLKNLSKLFEDRYPYNRTEFDFLNNKLHLTKKELLNKLKKEYPNEWIFFNGIIKKETVWMNKTIYISKNLKLWDATFTDL